MSSNALIVKNCYSSVHVIVRRIRHHVLIMQGGVTRTYTVGRSATAVKLLTREILGLTLNLLLYLFLTFDFLDFLPSLVQDLKSCINASVIIIFGCVMLPVE